MKAEGDHYSSEPRLMSCDYGCPKPTMTLSIEPLGSDISVNGKRYRRVTNGPRR
jgi:hypothetical protein